MAQKHWPIGRGVRSAILQLIDEEAVVVELGSGDGTKWLTERYDVWSVEHNEEWIGLCDKSKYIHAPIITLEDGKTEWYNPAILQENLPVNYDLLLVDGPPGTFGRQGLLEQFHLFRTDVPIIIDDTIRTEEAEIARELAYKLSRPLYVFWNFSIISPKPLSSKQISKIQSDAIGVLQEEDETYLKRYFKSPALYKVPNKEDWGRLYKEYKLESTKLERIINSWSYRIGRFITYPIRTMVQFFQRK